MNPALRVIGLADAVDPPLVARAQGGLHPEFPHLPSRTSGLGQGHADALGHIVARFERPPGGLARQDTGVVVELDHPAAQ
ncbi:MAG: hypothetical protein RJA19_160 [Bacteroidota bacterium]